MSDMVMSNDPTANDNKKKPLFALRTRLKKKKRRKDLEHLRQIVLEAKRNKKRQSSQARRSIPRKLPKNSLQATLNMFAEARRDNENKTQGLVNKKNGRKSKGRTICARLLPEPVIGIFKNGVKGKDVRRKAVKNFPSHGMNKTTQLHADVFGSPNNERNYTSPIEISLDNRNSYDNSNRNEHESCSTPPRNLQPFDMIKGIRTFNNEHSLKWISTSIRERKSREMRQMMDPNVLGNVQRGERNKRRVLKSSYDVDDHDTSVSPKMETQYFSQNPLKADGSPVRRELPTNEIRDEVRSIKRWGISPAFCYDEFSKMIEEKFIGRASYADVPNSLISIKATLLARYIEAREQHTNTDNDSTGSCTSCSVTNDEIPIFNQTAQAHKNHKKSHGNVDEFRRGFEGEQTILEDYMKCRGDKSLNCNGIIEPVSFHNEPAVKKQKNHIPPQQRRSNSGLSISHDINIDKYRRIDDVTNIQQAQRKTAKNGKFQNCSTHGDTNFCLSPEVILNKRNNKKANGIDTTNEMMNIYEFPMLRNKTVKARKSNDNGYAMRVDYSKYDSKKLTTPPLQIGSNYIHAPTLHYDIQPIDMEEHEHSPHYNRLSRSCSESMHCSDFLLSMYNYTKSLNDYNRNEHNDQKIIPTPSIGGFPISNMSFWGTSNVNFNAEPDINPTDTGNTFQFHVQHHLDANDQLKSAVLHDFKDLSFEEDDSVRVSLLNNESRRDFRNDHHLPRSYSNLYHPSKFSAVSDENINDRVLQRVPIFLNAKKPQSTSEIVSDELLSRVEALDRTKKCPYVSHLMNSRRYSRTMSHHHVNLKKKSREFSVMFKDNFPTTSSNEGNVKNAKIVPIRDNNNLRPEKSSNPKTTSQAFEITLDDGTAGFFIPRNYP